MNHEDRLGRQRARKLTQLAQARRRVEQEEQRLKLKLKEKDAQRERVPIGRAR